MLAALADAGVPAIHFGTGASTLLPAIAAAGGDVIGLDWRIPLDEGWALAGEDRAVQGNLDPAALLGPWERIEAGARDVLARADGRPGHIFNLGHGVLPGTDPDVLGRLRELVHAETARSNSTLPARRRDEGHLAPALPLFLSPGWVGARDGTFGCGSRRGHEIRPPPLSASVFGMSAAVVLMAYGSPDRLDDVPAYYADIRGGRPISPENLEDLVDRYRRLGIEESNPLNAITEETRVTPRRNGSGSRSSPA